MTSAMFKSCDVTSYSIKVNEFAIHSLDALDIALLILFVGLNII